MGTSGHTVFSRRNFLLGGAAVAVGVPVYAHNGGRHHIDLIQHDVFIADLPSAFQGFRIAQISDFHVGKYDETVVVDHAVERINQLAPDAVFCTGDFITHSDLNLKTNIDAANLCGSLLQGLKAPLKYGTFGNHENMLQTELPPLMAQYRIQILRNQHIALERGGDRIWIAGMADRMFDDPDPMLALPKHKPGEPVIVLGHEPDYVDDLTASAAANGLRADLLCAGHTHGGQINIPFARRFALPEFGRKYVHGPFQVASTLLYVNRGLGVIHLPVRFNAPPEITLFTLRAK